MKKQIAPSVKAHLIRGAFYLLLLVSVSTIPFALGSWQAHAQRTLTFAQRVAYQRAIEDVYWRHRIWPKERPDPKPSLDAVMSQAQLEKKVADYLRKSQALADYWQRPLLLISYRLRWIVWRSTPSSQRCYANSLKRSGMIPSLSLSVWHGLRLRSVCSEIGMPATKQFTGI